MKEGKGRIKKIIRGQNNLISITLVYKRLRIKEEEEEERMRKIRSRWNELNHEWNAGMADTKRPVGL